MKIRTKLQLTFIIIALLYTLMGFIEHKHIANVADSFRSLESHTTPSLTALLESSTAARRASIKAVEYSTRGKLKDREKAGEALQQLEQQLQQYLQLNVNTKTPEDFSKLIELKNNFIKVIQDYLVISEGPAIKQVIEEEKKLQDHRRNLIKTTNNALDKVPDALKYDLVVIKSEARKVSIKLVEFTLRGKTSDRLKAQDAIGILIKTQKNYLINSTDFPVLAKEVSDKVDVYIATAREFLQLMSSRKNSVNSIYNKEVETHTNRKNLIKALYPFINEQYTKLDDITNTATAQLAWSAQLQLYSILIITFIALLATYLLARSISTPFNKIRIAARQIGAGNLDVKLDLHSRDELGDLASSFQKMTNELQQQHEQREQAISLRNRELHELRRAENRLESAQRIARVGNWELDIPTNKLTWSDEIFHIFDIDKEKFTATYDAFLEGIHPEDREYINKAYTNSLKDKKPYGIEHRLLMKDGSIKYVHERCETTFDKDDNPIKSIGTVQDITERIHNESLANRMKHMLEHSVEEIYIFDGKSLKFIQVSSGALLNLGYDMEEMRYLTPVDLKPDYTTEKFGQLIEPLCSGKKEQLIFETRHRRKNGSYYPVEVRLQLTHEDVNPVYLAIILDLTERKHTEAELKSYRQHLEELVEERTAIIKTQASIIDQTHDSVVTTDLNGFITSWNKGAEKLFKIQASMALGEHISIIYPEQDHQFLQKEVIEPLKQQGSHEIEIMLKRGDNSEFPAHLSLSLLLNDDGSPKGMVGYSLDISVQKQREKELTLLTQQLQDSNKELEAFSYSVSHDLRSPLRSIDGFSLALIEDYGDQLDDTAQDYLQRVRKAAQRMGILIDDLLQLSRVNRAEFSITTVDLHNIAQSVIDELQTHEPERKVEFILEDQMLVQGDERLLRMVMANLIGNAWKFTAKEEKAQITLKSLADKPNVYYIKDNGVGFDMRHSDKLFGVFQRLHRATEFPGTGVGLATVQRIIYRHGGQIWAKSELGKGATFFFTLKPSIITQDN